MSEYYPRIVLNIRKLRRNIEEIQSRCAERGIMLTGVVKGCSGIPASAKAFEDAGVAHIGTSRLEQIREAREYGVRGPFMLLRVPMPSEADEAVRLAEISLNSEISTLRALDAAAAAQGKTHKVILMADLGDLREGFWDKDELLEAARVVERESEYLYLSGVGTNLGCYGSVFPTREKMMELTECAKRVEALIGRELDIVSGGATSSLPLALSGDMPERINHLRVGEGILNAKDLQDLFGCNMDFMHRDVFTLEAEVIEVKVKPSYPVGEIMYDAFGMKQEYEDRGMRRRALLALGRADYAFPDMILPADEGAEVIGASSDHTIIDVEDARRKIEVGDVMKFTPSYGANVFATSSPNVRLEVEDED
jgi:predicted amino acid racemase